MKNCSLVAITIVIAGCAVSGQKFLDDSWSWSKTSYGTGGAVLAEEQAQAQTVKGRSRTVAPPFNARAISGQQMTMQQDGEFWDVSMGSQNQLEGGDITATIEAMEKAMMSGALEAVVEMP